MLLDANVELLDDFTLNLITNEEVIAINQDALGTAASLATVLDNHVEVWSKPLEDGSMAIGLLNPTGQSVQTKLFLGTIQLNGSFSIRDLWSRKDVGVYENEFSTTIPSHGMMLLKFIKKK